MFKTYYFDIKEQWKKRRIVVAEFQFPGNVKMRAIVQKTLKDQQVETLYGNVVPTELYSFDNISEAQKFINAV